MHYLGNGVEAVGRFLLKIIPHFYFSIVSFYFQFGLSFHHLLAITSCEDFSIFVHDLVVIKRIKVRTNLDSASSCQIFHKERKRFKIHMKPVNRLSSVEIGPNSGRRAVAGRFGGNDHGLGGVMKDCGYVEGKDGRPLLEEDYGPLKERIVCCFGIRMREYFGRRIVLEEG